MLDSNTGFSRKLELRSFSQKSLAWVLSNLTSCVYHTELGVEIIIKLAFSDFDRVCEVVF